MDFIPIGSHVASVVLSLILIWEYFKGSKTLKIIMSVVIVVIFTTLSFLVLKGRRNK